MNTKNCILCDNKAVVYCKHIHTEIGIVSAGWCEEHRDSMNPSRLPVMECEHFGVGCCGKYPLSEVELLEEITKDSLKEQAEYMEFVLKVNQPRHKKTFIERLFGF